MVIRVDDDDDDGGGGDEDGVDEDNSVETLLVLVLWL